MKITKYGHCCLLIEQKNVRILFDPGMMSTQQNEAKNIDIIIITHEDSDHLSLDSLKTILQNNPKARIITNNSVGNILRNDKIPYEVVEDGQKTSIKGVWIEAVGNEHANIHPMIRTEQNTGYIIDDKFFYPGDAFTDPGREIDILALPVAAPWMKMEECLDYALQIEPKICIPVHDGILVEGMRKFAGMIAQNVLPHKIKFVQMNDNDVKEF